MGRKGKARLITFIAYKRFTLKTGDYYNNFLYENIRIISEYIAVTS